jgi:hypothetical protein
MVSGDALATTIAIGVDAGELAGRIDPGAGLVASTHFLVADAFGRVRFTAADAFSVQTHELAGRPQRSPEIVAHVEFDLFLCAASLPWFDARLGSRTPESDPTARRGTTQIAVPIAASAPTGGVPIAITIAVAVEEIVVG